MSLIAEIEAEIKDAIRGREQLRADTLRLTLASLRSAEKELGRPLKEAIPGWSAIADAVVVAGDAVPSTGRATTVPIDIGGREVWLSIIEFRLSTYRRGAVATGASRSESAASAHS